MLELLSKPQGKRKMLTVSDGVLKGRDIRRTVADYRAQESIRTTTQRILTENGCRVV